MFDRFSRKAINVIYMVSYGMIVIFLVHYIESIVLNLGYSIPVLNDIDRMFILNIILTSLFSCISLIFAFLLNREAKKYLVSDIDMKGVYFGIAIYLIVVSIGGLVNVVPEAIIFIIDSRLRHMEVYDTYRIVIISIRSVMPLAKILIALYFVRKSNYLVSNDVDGTT